MATLPYSNAYFAKAYPIERLESLLDGIESAFLYFGGATARVVLDNTSLAVKEILAGRDRVQTEAFEAFRGAYPFRAEFCAPAKGWEKGSVEGGVKYARNLVFRPRLAIKSWAALNAAVLTELEADLPLRHLDDGRSAQEALALERQHLRALPEHLPATCRVVARVADKFGHVRVDHVTYSVPIRHAYRPAWVKLYHDRVAIAVGAEVVAQHRRVFCRGAKVGNDSLSGLSLTSTQPASGSIPGPGEPGYETWGGVPFEQRAHVGAWMVPSYDPALGSCLHRHVGHVARPEVPARRHLPAVGLPEVRPATELEPAPDATSSPTQPVRPPSPAGAVHDALATGFPRPSDAAVVLKMWDSSGARL